MVGPTSVPEARALATALGAEARVGAEEVPLHACAGRIAAHDVGVAVALPRFDVSAMDGWAVRAADLAAATADAPVTLVPAGEARAGRPSAEHLVPGTTTAVSTGALLPAGADAVVRSEDAEALDGATPAPGAGDGAGVPAGVRFRDAVAAGHDVRRAGEDVRPGEIAVRAGEILHAGHVALLAGTGTGALLCRRRPRVTVLVTGDEVARTAGSGGADGDGADGPGGANQLASGAVHDVNGPAIAALLRAAGAEVVAITAVPDDRDATVRALVAAEGELVVSCGGVSAGPHDHVRPALAALGADERVGALALQPGKPAWLGALPGRPGLRPVLALPGNPGAALVVATLLAVPLLRAMAGRPPVVPVHALLAEGAPGDGRRTRALRVALEDRTDGTRIARALAGQQPHRLSSLAATTALALVPPSDAALPAGSVVEVVLLPGAEGAVPTPGVTFATEPADTPDAVAMQEAFFADIATRYAGGIVTVPALDPAEVRPPDGLWIVVRDGGVAVGCAGLRRLDDEAVEIKRVYLAPSARGRGIARRLMEHLHEQARRLGFRRARLDTGSAQPEAYRLYVSLGYRAIDDYNGNPAASHWFERDL